MASLNIERSIDSLEPLTVNTAIAFALQRAEQYLNLCFLSEDETEEVLRLLESKMSSQETEYLDRSEAISVSMRLLQESLPVSFNYLREQRCKPNAELRPEYSSFMQTGSLRAKTCPTVQRSSIGSASLERISFNIGKSVF